MLLCNATLLRINGTLVARTCTFERFVNGWLDRLILHGDLSSRTRNILNNGRRDWNFLTNCARFSKISIFENIQFHPMKPNGGNQSCENAPFLSPTRSLTWFKRTWKSVSTRLVAFRARSPPQIRAVFDDFSVTFRRKRVSRRVSFHASFSPSGFSSPLKKTKLEQENLPFHSHSRRGGRTCATIFRIRVRIAIKIYIRGFWKKLYASERKERSRTGRDSKRIELEGN